MTIQFRRREAGAADLFEVLDRVRQMVQREDGPQSGEEAESAAH